MKILFLSKYKNEYFEPIGIMTLSAFLKQKGHQCNFIDVVLERNYIKKIKEIRPDIIAYSITTGGHVFYQHLNAMLKKKMSFYSIFGGPHATFFPEFIEEEGVDAVCRGEGEYPLLELANALESRKDHTRISNLWVKHDGQIVRNEVRPLLENLDSLPFVDRDIVNKYNHYKKMHRRIVLTGRGCPYNCSYCFNHSFNNLYQGKGKIIRKRSVNHVMQELKDIYERHRPRRFQFSDDIFILDKQWCSDFCERYRAEIKIPFIAYTRTNLVTDEIIKKLKQAGCQTIYYAIESGNEYIRNKILNRDISEKTILDAVYIYKKYKLRTCAQNMIAIPDETLSMAFETVELNIKCRPDYAWCSIFQPYPRTRLGAYCREKGYISDEKFNESFHKKSILKLEHHRHFQNLHNLFSIAVSFPCLLPVIKFLIKLPLTNLYYFLWRLYGGWCYVFKIKEIDLAELFINE